VTAYGNIEIAVEAMKRGARDFVTKPWRNDQLAATIRAAIGARPRAAAPPVDPASGLLHRSPEMAAVMAVVDRTAPTEASVLILGENGSGKEVIARAIHARSARAGRTLTSIDLGAVSESVFESEMFGHRRGAFTDARDDRVGRIQAASGGTLFLDEIGNLPLRLQAKLLTVLERRELSPVGATSTVPIDVRVISATNLSPDRLRDGQVFRQDLLYRLNTVVITVPPLRARPADIDVLLDHYLLDYAARYGRPPPAVAESARAALHRYPWPGNVRELKHAAERAVIVGRGEALGLDDFGIAPSGLGDAGAPPPAGALNLEEIERGAVLEALRKHQWNVSRAARELGLTRTSLYRRMEKYRL
jgi:DNA-binding NtrC family response regulator